MHSQPMQLGSPPGLVKVYLALGSHQERIPQAPLDSGELHPAHDLIRDIGPLRIRATSDSGKLHWPYDFVGFTQVLPASFAV